MSVALETARPLRHAPRLGLAAFFALARQRRALARLDAAQLRDLGISREAAQSEAERPFWDLPEHWTR